MAIEIPDNWMGEPIKGSMKKVLGTTNRKRTGRTKQEKGVIPSANINNPENWILLNGRQHGSYQYDNLVVCMHRLGYSPDVERVAQSLGLSLQDTGEEKDGTKYIGNVNWDEAMRVNLSLGNMTLTPRQGLDLLIDVKKGISGKRKKKLYDGRGNVIGEEKLRILYDEIVGVREPWRAEWLDAKFDEIGSGLQISYGHVLDGNKQLKTGAVEALEDCLMEGNYMSIPTANRQGMATKAVNKSELYFGYPVDGTVARFIAYSDWAYLDCYGGPDVRNASLGVRAVRRADAKN